MGLIYLPDNAKVSFGHKVKGWIVSSRNFLLNLDILLESDARLGLLSETWIV